MTDSGVWFGLLGPVELRLAGAQVPIRSARARALLAALLCRPNVLLSADELIDLVWGERAPSGAATTLRSHVMRVRRLLEDSADRVETMAAGYRIHVDLSTELDWAIFEERCLSGRAAARRGDWPAVTQDVSEALALWRGTPLSDVDSERLRRDEQPALIEARVAAVELLTRAALEQGRAVHEGVVAVHVPKDQADAVDWGEREHANLIEAVRLGTQYALPDLARRLSRATWTFFNQQQHFESWITTNELALTAVREHGDAEAEAAVSNNLATALAASGRPEEALVHLERCAEIRRAQGDVQRLGGILSNMGIAAMQAGRPEQAQAHFEEALALPTTIEFQATAHANLGHFHLLLGHHEDSIAQSLASAELCRRRPEPDVDLGTVLGNLADAYRGLGDLSEAALHAREAVAVMRTISSRPGLIENLERLASILEKAGGDAEQREAADLRAEAATLAPPT